MKTSIEGVKSETIIWPILVKRRVHDPHGNTWSLTDKDTEAKAMRKAAGNAGRKKSQIKFGIVEGG